MSSPARCSPGTPTVTPLTFMNVSTQPVATSEVVRMLLDLATGDRTGDTDIAGPKVELLVEQVRELVRRGDKTITVVPVDAPSSMAAGSRLPDADAIIRGPDWLTWLNQQAF